MSSSSSRHGLWSSGFVLVLVLFILLVIVGMLDH
ncbi:MAG: YjcZ family sporulation protein [Bacillota bacterium]|jgi:conserved hypothetical tiny transmembrane protein|nr:sporulation protein YjcZ [Bacillota bacterium]